MKLKELFDADFLWKVLVYVMCACIIVHGCRITGIEKRVDALQDAFLKKCESDVEITTMTAEAFAELYPRIIVIEKKGEENSNEDTSN